MKGMREELIMIIRKDVKNIERKLDRYVELVYRTKSKIEMAEGLECRIDYLQ